MSRWQQWSRASLTISTVHGHLFFGINLPWPGEVFIEVLAPGGEAGKQIDGIRDITVQVRSINEYLMQSLYATVGFCLLYLQCRGWTKSS